MCIYQLDDIYFEYMISAYIYFARAVGHGQFVCVHLFCVSGWSVHLFCVHG